MHKHACPMQFPKRQYGQREPGFFGGTNTVGWGEGSGQQEPWEKLWFSLLPGYFLPRTVPLFSAHQTQGSCADYSFGPCVNQLLLPLSGETELENLPLSSSSFRGGIWAGTPETLAQTPFQSTDLLRES